MSVILKRRKVDGEHWIAFRLSVKNDNWNVFRKNACVSFHSVKVPIFPNKI